MRCILHRVHHAYPYERCSIADTLHIILLSSHTVYYVPVLADAHEEGLHADAHHLVDRDAEENEVVVTAVLPEHLCCCWQEWDVRREESVWW